ncbi:MAG: radical SAM protein [Planctomycetota bacterium]|nr:radical SAM protein [Planctomycetota bacterium]
MTTELATQPTYLERLERDIEHVVIVYPFTYVNPYTCLPPLGAEYLQAGVHATGRTSVLLDMRFEDDIRAELAKADLVCMYGFFEDCSLFGKWHIHVIDEVLEQIPDDVPVVAGGTGFGKPEETLEAYPRVDVHMVGLPDTPIRQLLDANTPEDVDCLTYRTSDGGSVQNQRVTHRLSDDVYPVRSLRNPKYRYECVGIEVDLVRAAMGCNYHCRFCYQYGKDTDGKYLRWQGRSPESQYKELSEVTAPIVLWVDDDMTTDMEALDQLSDLLIENKVRKVLIGTGRVDHVAKGSVETLKKMERAGFFALAFGIESLSDKTLRFYRKGQTVELAKKSMDMLKQTNILLVCNFLLGSPGETEEDMMEYLWFGGTYGIDHLVTNRLRVPQGSYLHSLIYEDGDETRFKPGMQRIRGRELKRIKNRIKFGQGTPGRMVNTFLKIGRHRGMHVDPLYWLCCALHALAKTTWLDKLKIIHVLLFIPKLLSRLPAFRWLTRGLAYVLTPPFWVFGHVWEWIERKVGIFTRLLPFLFGRVGHKVLKKQKEQAQLATTRGIR